MEDEHAATSGQEDPEGPEKVLARGKRAAWPFKQEECSIEYSPFPRTPAAEARLVQK